MKTGIFKPNENKWPGVFICGDDVLGFAQQITMAQEAGFLPNDGAGFLLLLRLVELLKSCSVQ